MMKDNKIEFTTPTFRGAPAQKKKPKPDGKKQVASRWQEVEEKRDPSKSGVVNNLKQSKKERFLTLKERQKAAANEDKEQSPFEMFASVNTKKIKDFVVRDGDDIVSVDVDIERDHEIDAVEEAREDVIVKEPLKTLEIAPVLTAAPLQNSAPVDQSYATPVSSVSGSTFQNLKLLDFVGKLVKKITIMKASGKTEITLTLKNLSLFNGGTLKVIEHDSAKGQYNIVFSNLNAKAHALVTSPHAEQLLKEALAPKGFTFHIISATTEMEPVASSYAASAHEERDERSDPQDEERDA